MLRRVLLALVLLTPLAAAQETLASLEEPHAGTDKVWDVTVTEEEAGEQRVLIYRNPPGRVFGLVVYDASGAELFARNGTRGVQTLPPLEPGAHKFFVRGEGAFQVTDKAFERTLAEDSVQATLQGTDAYVLAPSQDYLVDFTGDVRVEWWSLAGSPEDLRPPANRTAMAGNAYVMTVRGDEGASYGIALTPTEHTPASPTEAPTPALPVALLLLLVGAIALRRRR